VAGVPFNPAPSAAWGIHRTMAARGTHQAMVHARGREAGVRARPATSTRLYRGAPMAVMAKRWWDCR